MPVEQALESFPLILHSFTLAWNWCNSNEVKADTGESWNNEALKQSRAFFPPHCPSPLIEKFKGKESVEVAPCAICASKQIQKAVSQTPGWISRLTVSTEDYIPRLQKTTSPHSAAGGYQFLLDQAATDAENTTGS